MAVAVALVDDLMFLSRIKEAARGAATEVKAARRVDQVVEACREGARLVLLDLDSDRLPALEALAALRADPALAGTTTVGFLGHLEADRARLAREAGCGQVLARSAFVQRLPEILRTAAGNQG